VAVSSPLAITYLLEDTELSGGVKVVLNQANMMASRGHRVTVVSKGGPPKWIRFEIVFRRVAAFNPAALPEADVTVATYWTTIGPALEAPSRAATHYCQGFEAGLVHNVGDHEAILEAYRAPIPSLAVSEDLANLVRSRFGRPVRVVPPGLEPFWRPRWRWQPRRRARVVVMHPFEFYMKGVDVGLEAVRRMRALGVECVVVRISQWPLSDAERRVLVADEFYQHLAPCEVARLLRRADLLLAPSWESEGFGLPVLEAMASGVPVVASDIAAFRGFATSAAALVPFDQPERFAQEAAAILADPQRWRTMRASGLIVARAFSQKRVAAIAEDALYWVAEGRWRNEP
jgi:glycosyltransferase involved in cell wall biosynthesis